MPDPGATRQPTGSAPTGNIAQPWYDAGCSVVPIQANGTKRPTRDWSSLQHARMPQAEVTWSWREGQSVGVAVICGRISGDLEMLELEAGAFDSGALNLIRGECKERGVEELWDSLQHESYAEWTPSGGIHLLYRISDQAVPKNTKIAQTATGKTLAETRGEGGYVIVAPTSGSCHPSGEPWVTVAGSPATIMTISWAQRTAIHNAITAALDQTPPPPPVVPYRQVVDRTGEDMRPGDLWEQDHDWEESWFTDLGWQVSHRVGGETFWVRPGKDLRDGHSASTGYNNQKDRLYVWSTSAGLPTETPLSMFFVYAHYYYHGDMSLAAKALRIQGYEPNKPLTSQPGTDLQPWEPDATPNKEVVLAVAESLDLTDTGSGRAMKEMFGERFRWNTQEKAWYRWTGICWTRDQHMEIERAAEQVAEHQIALARFAIDEAIAAGDDPKDARAMFKTAKTLLNETKIQAAIKRFAAQPGIAVTSDAFNSNSDLLNLSNGTLDLGTLELYDHRPGDLLTMTFGAELDKDASCPKFESFMCDAFPDVSVRDYVQRSLGYSLLGRADQRAIFMLHGPSGTGKSVLTSLMSTMFGDYGVTAPASTFRLKSQGDTLDLHRLRGARFVTSSELPEGQQLDEDLVKRFTGGDKVMSRGHYQEFQEWKPTAVVWLATNFLPKINSDDNAIWIRAKPIHMGTEFIGSGRQEIPGYANIMFREEASGIFNWLIAGLEAYRLRGLDEPDAVTQDVINYRTDVNSVACFIRDQIEDGVLIREPESEIKSTILRSMFESYCTENHVSPLGQRRYQNRLKALGLEPFKTGGQAMWRGIRQNLELGVLGSWR